MSERDNQLGDELEESCGERFPMLATYDWRDIGAEVEASDWLRRDRARERAEALIAVADGTRFPSDWILFRRSDGSGVTVGDLLRETAARHLSDAGIGGGGDE